MGKILLLERADCAAQIQQDLFFNRNHLMEKFDSAETAPEKLDEAGYDVIVLDAELPYVDCVQFCKQFRGDGGTARILVLTSSERVDEMISALDAGADDCLNKPIDASELAARVRALERRPAVILGRGLAARGLVLDPQSCSVLRDGEQISLHPMEFALLDFLLRHPNQVFETHVLWERVWKSSMPASTDTVRTHLKTLRRKIDRPGEPSLITTLRGRGYKVEMPEL